VAKHLLLPTGSKATGRTISWRASPLILNVRPFLSLRFGGKNFAEHSKYADP